MGHYLTLFQYSPEAQAKLVQNPEDRSQAMRELIAQAGGSLLEYHYCFGEYDGVFLFEAPDPIAAQAVSYAIAATGTVQHERTITLMTVDEKMQVLQKAKELSHQPPG